MLKLTQPTITGSILTRPLLSLSRPVTRQASASALRACWDRTTPRDRILRGLTMTRMQIQHYNKENDNSAAPMFMFERQNHGDEKHILCVFSDASATVWRCKTPNDVSADYDEFQALPAILRLSSVARVKDQGPIIVKVRKETPGRLGLFLSEEKDCFVSLTAGWTTGSGALDYDARKELQAALMDEVAAWTDLIDDLPALHVPPLGEPSEGVLGPETLTEIGAPADAQIAYAVPAFIDWRWITNDEADELRAFTKDILAWLWVKYGAEADIEIDTAPLVQMGTIEPSIVVKIANSTEMEKKALGFENRCKCALLEILQSDIAPSGASKLLGQELCEYKNQRPWISPLQVARCFYNKKSNPLTAHEVIELHTRFDRFRLWASSADIEQTA